MIYDAETAIRLDAPRDTHEVGVQIASTGLPHFTIWFSAGLAPGAEWAPEKAEFARLEVGGKGDGPIRRKSVERIAANLDLFVDYARAVLINDQGDKAKALELFHNLGKTKRGQPREFFQGIAEEYRERKAKGELHLVKAIAQAHHVTPSAASRWIKSARQYGYLEED